MAPSRFLIQRIYGYLVCLVAIITLLISASMLTNSIFELSRPRNFNPLPEANVSYQDYRLRELERAATVKEKTGRLEVIPDDTMLRRMYDEDRRNQQRIAQEQQKSQEAFERWNGMRAIVTSSIMLVIAVILFMLHWRWVRSLDRGAAHE